MQFVKMSVDGGKMFVGGSIDACYEYSLSNKEESVINKFDFWSILVTEEFVYIGGFKEVCVYDLSKGRITKSIKTKDFVYCIIQLDSDHFLCGSCKGHLEIINANYQEVLSESKVSGTIFDICQGSNPTEYFVGGASGLTIIEVDPTYHDYDIEIIDRLFKNRGILRLAKVKDIGILIAF